MNTHFVPIIKGIGRSQAVAQGGPVTSIHMGGLMLPSAIQFAQVTLG